MRPYACGERRGWRPVPRLGHLDLLSHEPAFHLLSPRDRLHDGVLCTRPSLTLSSLNRTEKQLFASSANPYRRMVHPLCLICSTAYW